ncbi:hypothetical protein B0H17DRAFT_1187139 [Mycena rosella]|uniref:Uncharacterized protein n=1 Tax=Mycena rosella TaxID=1033263 RepID=A0AAD7C6R1_MYCRO|nr:hypothetical protein B0H17DRAFT_1187139 [Mycena rosella]
MAQVARYRVQVMASQETQIDSEGLKMGGFPACCGSVETHLKPKRSARRAQRAERKVSRCDVIAGGNGMHSSVAPVSQSEMPARTRGPGGRRSRTERHRITRGCGPSEPLSYLPCHRGQVRILILNQASVRQSDARAGDKADPSQKIAGLTKQIIHGNRFAGTPQEDRGEDSLERIADTPCHCMAHKTKGEDSSARARLYLWRDRGSGVLLAQNREKATSGKSRTKDEASRGRSRMKDSEKRVIDSDIGSFGRIRPLEVIYRAVFFFRIFAPPCRITIRSSWTVRLRLRLPLLAAGVTAAALFFTRPARSRVRIRDRRGVALEARRARGRGAHSRRAGSALSLAAAGRKQRRRRYHRHFVCAWAAADTQTQTQTQTQRRKATKPQSRKAVDSLDTGAATSMRSSVSVSDLARADARSRELSSKQQRRRAPPGTRRAGVSYPGTETISKRASRGAYSDADYPRACRHRAAARSRPPRPHSSRAPSPRSSPYSPGVPPLPPLRPLHRLPPAPAPPLQSEDASASVSSSLTVRLRDASACASRSSPPICLLILVLHRRRLNVRHGADDSIHAWRTHMLEARQAWRCDGHVVARGGAAGCGATGRRQARVRGGPHQETRPTWVALEGASRVCLRARRTGVLSLWKAREKSVSGFASASATDAGWPWRRGSDGVRDRRMHTRVASEARRAGGRVVAREGAAGSGSMWAAAGLLGGAHAHGWPCVHDARARRPWRHSGLGGRVGALSLSKVLREQRAFSGSAGVRGLGGVAGSGASQRSTRAKRRRVRLAGALYLAGARRARWHSGLGVRRGSGLASLEARRAHCRRPCDIQSRPLVDRERGDVNGGGRKHRICSDTKRTGGTRGAVGTALHVARRGGRLAPATVAEEDSEHDVHGWMWRAGGGEGCAGKAPGMLGWGGCKGEDTCETMYVASADGEGREEGRDDTCVGYSPATATRVTPGRMRGRRRRLYRPHRVSAGKASWGVDGSTAHVVSVW